jgi:hypothetical protein
MRFPHSQRFYSSHGLHGCPSCQDLKHMIVHSYIVGHNSETADATRKESQ